MSNLQEFNKTLKNLKLEAKRLKAISDAYKKLEDLIKVNENIISVLKENNVTFKKLNEIQKKHNSEINRSIGGIYDSIDSMKHDLLNLIAQRTDVIRKENKEFYRDLESTIKIKLDDHRSQIKQLIESERSQIKEIIELETLKQTNELKKDNKAVKASLWVIGTILIILSVILVYKSIS